jgi:pyruvate dehydrogenase phosphatase
VVQDRNAATHLVRNALGGKNQEQVSALLTLPAPISRRYRDDLTVQVIFFGTQPPVQVQQQLQLQDGKGKSGQVVINLDATAPGEPPKPKL